LIAAKVLPAERWGDRWRIDRAEVDRLLAQDREGRPYAPVVAWHALALLDPRLRPPAPGRQQRARARGYAAEIAAGRIGGLRRRARVERGRVHVSLLALLIERIVVSGAAAIAADDPNRLVGDDFVEGYVRASRWAALADEFGFDPGPDPNVIMHVVDDRVWPFDRDDGTASPVVAAVDLLEQGDERAERAARSILARAGSGR
jgi:hypothetical protein